MRLVILVFACVSTVSSWTPPDIELPTGAEWVCSPNRASWTCRAPNGVELTGSVKTFGGLPGGASVEHPAAQCLEKSSQATRIHYRTCVVDGQYYNTLLKVPAELPGSAFEDSRPMLRGARFTALEEACVAKTGAPCP